MYKLSKVGQAIDNNDLSAASSVLGGSTDTDWVKKANIAFTKVKAIIYVLDVDCILVACIVLLLEEIAATDVIAFTKVIIGGVESNHWIL